MADFFIDNYCSRIINKIIDDKEYLPSDTATFKSLARLMFKHYPPKDVFQMIQESLAEASDDMWFEKKWMKDKTFPKRNMDYKVKRKSVIKLNLKKQAIRKKINDNLNITEVAESYGIIIKKGKALCPFHKEKKPSLVFYDKTNSFKCYGCQAKGDIVEFIRRCESEVSKV